MRVPIVATLTASPACHRCAPPFHRALQQAWRREADVEEAQAVQQERHLRPRRAQRHARGRRDHVDAPRPDRAGDDDREHAADPEHGGDRERQVRRQQRHGEGDVRLAHEAVEPREQAAEREAEHAADAGDPRELADHAAPRERALQHDDDGDLHADEAGGVVDQALAAEDRGHAPRHPQLLEHRLRGDGVGRRHDRTEEEARGPRQLRQEPVRDQADDEDRQRDEADRQHQDRPQPTVEVAPRRLPRVGVQQRRQEAEQDQVRRRRQRTHRRDHGEADAGEGEGQRLRQTQARRQQGDDGEGGEDGDQGLQRGEHGAQWSGCALATPARRNHRRPQRARVPQ